jgi:Spy/CpxP family protein refolding chaperone
MTRTIRAYVVAFALSAASNVAFAQKGPPEQPDQDFARYLFPPELIMQFQQKINLRPEQRTSITQAIQQLQSKVIDLQWQMQSEVQKLTEMMQAPTIKEAEALAQVDRVLGIERDVKRTHLGTLIRIKNTLTREQQTALDSLQQMWAKKAPRSENTVKEGAALPPRS